MGLRVFFFFGTWSFIYLQCICMCAYTFSHLGAHSSISPRFLVLTQRAVQAPARSSRRRRVPVENCENISFPPFLRSAKQSDVASTPALFFVYFILFYFFFAVNAFERRAVGCRGVWIISGRARRIRTLPPQPAPRLRTPGNPSTGDVSTRSFICDWFGHSRARASLSVK